MDAAQREILAANLKRVRERIAAACARVRRDPKEVTLIAVTKTVGPDVMQALIELGVTDIGENRYQAAREKFPQVPALKNRKPGEGRVTTHFIGHLQTNKVKGVLELFDVIHSVDSVKLADEVDKRATRRVEVFVEVNSGETSKSGVAYAELPQVLEAVRQCAQLRLLGLMTMAAAEGDPRPAFEKLRAASPGALSMGMSNDFEIAIEEGATHVRIGTALFEGIT